MLRISMLMMSVCLVSPSFAQNENQTSDSIFKTVTLQEVKVTVPFKTRMNGDALITRIVGTSIANAGTANDALAKIPGMMKQNGELQVIGKGTPIYYINGRKVQDLTELQRLSSHDIKDVEVITTPGARYDVQISAVVRIRTLRQRGDGIGITYESREEKALSCTNNRWNSTLNLTYHYKSVDWFGGLTYGNSYLGKYDTQLVQHTFGKRGNYVQAGSTGLSQKDRRLNFNLGVDWQVAENHSLGMKVEHYTNLKGTSDFLMNDDILKDNLLIDQLTSHTLSDTKHSNSWLANAYYIGKIGKWSIDWNMDYYQTRDEVGSYTEEISKIENRELDANTLTRNHLFATKLVLSHPLKEGNLSFGAEMAFVNRKSDYSINTSNINDSNNEVVENTYAAFVEYSKMIRRFGSLSFGARYEHIDFKYDDQLDASSCLNRHLDNIYPYLSLGTRLGEWQGSLSYAIKTRRPNYRSLRSNIQYNNRFTLSTGNPTLKNETRHEVGANARWRYLAFSLNYTYVKDGIYDWTYPYDDEGTVLVSWVNFDKPIHQVGAFVNLSPVVGIWQPNYTFGVQKQWLSFCLDDPRSQTGKREVRYNKPFFIFNTNNAFRLPTKNEDDKGAWQLELNSELTSNGHYGNAELKNWNWNLSCAIQKSFLRNDALTVRLEVSDIFHQAYNNVVIDLGNNILTQSHILGRERGQYDLQRITLTARYNFNVSKNRYKGKGASKSFIERM